MQQLRNATEIVTLYVWWQLYIQDVYEIEDWWQKWYLQLCYIDSERDNMDRMIVIQVPNYTLL